MYKYVKILRNDFATQICVIGRQNNNSKNKLVVSYLFKIVSQMHVCNLVRNIPENELVEGGLMPQFSFSQPILAYIQLTSILY